MDQPAETRGPRHRLPASAVPVAVVAVLIGGMLNAASSAAVVPTRPQALALVAHGNGQVAFVTSRTGNQEIYLMNRMNYCYQNIGKGLCRGGTDGVGVSNFTNDPGNDFDPAWSPDGTQIAFVSDRSGNNDIYVANVNGSGLVDLTNNPASDRQPTWSPDGRQIAFTTDRDGNDEIYIMKSDGSSPTNLTNDPSADSDPAWSPDNTQIAFTSDRSGNQDVWLVGTDASGLLNLTANSAADRQPAWSPDNRFIAFTTNRDANDQIYFMNADGTNLRRVTNDAFSDTEPVFSPDKGTRLAFVSDATGNDDLYFLNITPTGSYGLVNVTRNGAVDSSPAWQGLPPFAPNGSPIQHVVVLFQENHSFDDVLGYLCATTVRSVPCDGATTGLTSTGTVVPLARATDIPPPQPHGLPNQIIEIDHGKMDGWDKLSQCTETTGYACYVQYQQDQIPNFWNYAVTYAINDRTFESDPMGSWGSHLNLGASFMDGFTTGFDYPGTMGKLGEGKGCDSGRDGDYRLSIYEKQIHVPLCIPQIDGTGPYRPSPVAWTPTLWDRLDDAGLTWGLFAPQEHEGGYGWSTCPTFADCLYTTQQRSVFKSRDFQTAALSGDLPSYSVVIPQNPNSQHNGYSMIEGDNWLADNVNAVMNGPDWNSTAIFISYDDCGCFYDHVAPPKNTPFGTRAPMVIISPYAKANYTDHTIATFNSMLAYVEHTFGLAPLSLADATIYDFSDAFDYTQKPLAPVLGVQHEVPASSIRWMKEHPQPKSMFL